MIINDDDPLTRCWRSGQPRMFRVDLHIPSQMETVTGHKRWGAEEFRENSQRSVPHTV
jgi:hypothetical protein